MNNQRSLKSELVQALQQGRTIRLEQAELSFRRNSK